MVSGGWKLTSTTLLEGQKPAACHLLAHEPVLDPQLVF